MPFPPIGIPGEPDVLAEVRLRAELKLLRTTATMMRRMQAMEKAFLKGTMPPEEVAELIIITSPTMKIKPQLKERLLKTETYFIEKGWRLPKWKRASWLLE